MSSFKSNENIHKKEDGSYCKPNKFFMLLLLSVVCVSQAFCPAATTRQQKLFVYIILFPFAVYDKEPSEATGLCENAGWRESNPSTSILP